MTNECEICAKKPASAMLCDVCWKRDEDARDRARRSDQERHGFANDVDGAKPPDGWAWAKSYGDPHGAWSVVRLSSFARIEACPGQRDATLGLYPPSDRVAVCMLIFAPLPMVLAAVRS